MPTPVDPAWQRRSDGSGSQQIMRAVRPSQPPAPPLLRPDPPAEPPALDQPSWLGRAVGYTPNTTLGKQVGRWYDNAGGLDKAIQGAQKSQDGRNERVLDGLLWPKWKPEDVTTRTPSSITVSKSDDAPEGAAGVWYPESRQVWIDKDFAGRQSTLEHELSHNAYARNDETLTKQRQAAESGDAGWHMPHDERAAYLTDPTEVDVRLAEIKRHYAHHTGRLVDSPEEAQKAWDWWRSYSRNFDPGVNESLERPGENPSLEREDFEFYDNALSPQMKQQMLHRMPELVRSEDKIREYRQQLG